MIQLRLFGTFSLQDASSSLRPEVLLTQPKRLALLAYLAAADTGTFHRRDTLVGLLWPELDAEHARGALSQAIRYLRGALGDDAIINKGHEELRLNGQRVWCDVVALERAFRAGHFEESLDYYRGQFLAGFFVSGAPGLEQWIDDERTRLRERASAAARALTQREEAAGNFSAAARWARRAVEYSSFDEAAVCRVMELLDRCGDRAGALQEYERLCRRLADEIGVDPAPETQALADAIRTRKHPHGAAQQISPLSSTQPPLAIAAAAPVVGSNRKPRALIACGIVLAVVGLSASARALLLRGQDIEPRRAVVMPFVNRTGDATLDPLAYVAADLITQGLAWSRITQIVPAQFTSQILRDFTKGQTDRDGGSLSARLARATGAGIVVTGSYHRRGDMLEFQSQIVDARTGELLRALEPARARVTTPVLAIDLLRRRIMGALAVRFETNASMTNQWLAPPTYEAYELFVEGMDLKSRGKRKEAIERFTAAAAADSTFVTPLVVAAIEYMNLGEHVKADSLCKVVSRSRALVSPVDRQLLIWLEGQLAADWDRSLVAIGELSKVSHIFRPQVVMDLLNANRPREALQAHKNIGIPPQPLPIQLIESKRMTDAYHRLGKHRHELRLAAQEHERQPDRLEPMVWQIRALGALGRTAELGRMLDAWRALPPQPEWTLGEAMLEAADELRVHGHTSHARDMLDHALEWYRSRPGDEMHTERHRAGYASALLRSDRPNEAQPILESLRAEFASPIYDAAYGVLLARRGDRVGAQQIDQQLAAAARPFSYGLYPLLRARIAAQLGDDERAIALLTSAVTEGLVVGTTGPAPPRWAGRPHLDPALDALRSHAAFQHLMRPE